MATISLFWVACIARVSVRFPDKERGTEVKDRAKNGASKRAGRRLEEVGIKGRKLSPSPFVHFLALVPFFARPKLLLVPRSFFAKRLLRRLCFGIPVGVFTHVADIYVCKFMRTKERVYMKV